MKALYLPFLLLLFFSCSKDKREIWVEYTMTQCADPWQNSPEYGQDKEAALKKYLEAQNIEVRDLNIKLDTLCAKTIQCTACTCSSCLVASVQICEDDLAEIQKLKFKRK